MLTLFLALQLQAASPTLNPNAGQLFERDPVLASWALRRFDRNRDGWLTLHEAQPALAAFKDIADGNRDDRVSVREYEAAKAFLAARDGIATAATTAEPLIAVR